MNVHTCLKVWANGNDHFGAAAGASLFCMYGGVCVIVHVY